MRFFTNITLPIGSIMPRSMQPHALLSTMALAFTVGCGDSSGPGTRRGFEFAATLDGATWTADTVIAQVTPPHRHRLRCPRFSVGLGLRGPEDYVAHAEVWRRGAIWLGIGRFQIEDYVRFAD